MEFYELLKNAPKTDGNQCEFARFQFQQHQRIGPVLISGGQDLFHFVNVISNLTVYNLLRRFQLDGFLLSLSILKARSLRRVGAAVSAFANNCQANSVIAVV